MVDVTLRDVQGEDIVRFYEHQMDPDARWMAAFTAADATDWEAFAARWDRIRAGETVTAQAIVVEGEVAGNIVSFEYLGRRNVGYWLGRAFWGQGIATVALQAFLELVTERPLYASVVKDNFASRRVLEKCGFEVVGERRGFAQARGEEVGEFEFRLGEKN